MPYMLVLLFLDIDWGQVSSMLTAAGLAGAFYFWLQKRAMHRIVNAVMLTAAVRFPSAADFAEHKQDDLDFQVRVERRLKERADTGRRRRTGDR